MKKYGYAVALLICLSLVVYDKSYVGHAQEWPIDNSSVVEEGFLSSGEIKWEEKAYLVSKELPEDLKKLKDLIDIWSVGMRRQYAEIPQEQLVAYLTAKVFRVEGEEANWEVVGNQSVAKANETNTYRILTAYQTRETSQGTPHLYFFTLHQERPIVLYSENKIETSQVVEMTTSQNQELVVGFSELCRRHYMKYPQSLLNKIKSTMFDYEKDSREKWYAISLATHRHYYNLAAPDQILAESGLYVHGKAVVLQSYGQRGGNGVEKYMLMDCYINESGTKLIFFAEHEGIPVILVATEKPNEQNEVNFEISDDGLLNSAFE